MEISGKMHTNAEELQMLFEDPGKLIVCYEPIIRAVVQIHINKGEMKQADKAEVVHYVIDALYARVDKIQKQYNGQAMLKTYCAAIIRNLCREWSRVYNRNKPPARLVQEGSMEAYGLTNPFHQALIQDEIRYFGRILSLFGPFSAKLSLFLKAYFRIPVNRADLIQYAPGMTDEEITRYLQVMAQHHGSKDQEIYRALHQLVRQYESRRNSPDAVRKWIKARVMDLVGLMNHGRQTSYEPETLQILAEHYFMAELTVAQHDPLMPETKMDNHA